MDKKRRSSSIRLLSSKSKLKRDAKPGSSPSLERRSGGAVEDGSPASTVNADGSSKHAWEMLPDDEGNLVTSEECSYRIIPPEFHPLVSTKEDYIFSSRIKCPSEVVKTFVLTRNSVYKLVREGDDLIVKSVWDLMDLYRVGGFPKNPAKKVHFHVRMLHVPEELNKKVKVLGFGVGEASWECIRKKEYICETINERVDWIWSITHLWTERWQYFFEVEKALIPSPEIYQIHYFCSELLKKKLQFRYLVLSSHALYCLEVRPTKKKVEIVKTRWKLPIKELEQLIVYPRTDNRAISILVNATCSLVKHKTLKEELTFIMNSENERNDLRISLKRLYIQNVKQRISEAIREES